MKQLRKRLIFETTYATYTATEVSGEGGVGRVYRAVDENGDEYAIKLLDPEKANRDKLRRFKNEINFGMQYKHENIVAVLDSGLYQGTKGSSPFYVMRFYPNSLRQLIEQGIPHDKALVYFSQLLNGVEAAHLRKVVHRDIKPENVLHDPVTDRLLLADFGIAHMAEDLLLTLVDTQVGARLANFQYAAPEQRARGREVDARSDIYALGLILNELFTGELALGTDYKSVAAVAPPYGYLDSLVTAMLKQNPQHRPQSIDEIKRELIGRRVIFINQQKVSQLRDVVIPTTETDDPLISDPVRLIGIDWDNGTLYLKLSRAVNKVWEDALHNMGSYTSLMGKGPETFQFKADTGIVSVREHDVQAIVDYFKTWLPLANRQYEHMVKEDLRRKDELKRVQLQKEIDERERRQRIVQNTKI